MWVRAWAASSKGIVSSVSAWFRADSGTNLIKQGEIVAGRPCGSVAQWSECSHGLREVLGSSPGRAMCFFLLCDIYHNSTTAFPVFFCRDLFREILGMTAVFYPFNRVNIR